MATVPAAQGHSLVEAAFSSEAQEVVAGSRIAEAAAAEAEETTEVSPGAAATRAAAALAEIGKGKRRDRRHRRERQSAATVERTEVSSGFTQKSFSVETSLAHSGFPFSAIPALSAITAFLFAT